MGSLEGTWKRSEGLENPWPVGMDLLTLIAIMVMRFCLIKKFILGVYGA
jgi:hypothetical protein